MQALALSCNVNSFLPISLAFDNSLTVFSAYSRVFITSFLVIGGGTYSLNTSFP